MPSLVFNLFFIAFGFLSNKEEKAYHHVLLTVECLETIFMIEIIINFFVSFKDIETYEEIFSIRAIAFNFIRHGEFIPLFIPVLPVYTIMMTVNIYVKTETGDNYFDD